MGVGSRADVVDHSSLSHTLCAATQLMPEHTVLEKVQKEREEGGKRERSRGLKDCVRLLPILLEELHHVLSILGKRFMAFCPHQQMFFPAEMARTTQNGATCKISVQTQEKSFLKWRVAQRPRNQERW